MGKSSSGKDTIYKGLLNNKTLNLQKIVPYTTRPIREGEQNGVEYYFLEEADVEKLKDENKIIEMRTYNTCHGPWRYLTVKDHQIELDENNYLIIGTPDSYLSIKEYFGEDVVVPIMILLDDGVRLQRALDRERNQEEPKYEEMCRRFLADAKDFSPEKMEGCNISHEFVNNDLVHCIKEIESFIQSYKD